MKPRTHARALAKSVHIVGVEDVQDIREVGAFGHDGMPFAQERLILG